MTTHILSQGSASKGLEFCDGIHSFYHKAVTMSNSDTDLWVTWPGDYMINTIRLPLFSAAITDHCHNLIFSAAITDHYPIFFYDKLDVFEM